METKICKICGIEKNIEEFRKSYSSLRKKYYYRSECRECERKQNREYNRRKYNNTGKELDKKYHDEHREFYREYNKKYYQEHKKEINEKRRKRKWNDRIFYLTINVRKSILNSFNRKSYKKSNKTEKITGLKNEQMTKYLLKTFKDRYGYEWDGKESVHIDHIMPLATAKTEEEVIKLCYYTNLQLLKAEDNWRKSDRLDF